MCGRIGLVELTWRQLVSVLRAEVAPEHQERFRPRHNLAPAQEAWICRQVEDRREIVPATWGFRSFPGAGPLIINARSETAAAMKTFRRPFQEQRCVVPASGFFEWKRGEESGPHWFTSSAELLLMAGLYREGPDGLCFVVLTTAANETMRPIHHRMPVLLSPDGAQAWLDRPDQDLLRPAPDGYLNSRRVSRKVNSVGFDGPECLEPAAEEGGPAQLRLKLQ